MPNLNAPISSPAHRSVICSSTDDISSLSLSSSVSQPFTSAPAAAPQPATQSQNSADPFLRDFTLVAEAAKRAQVAVMVREFENCGLS
ncbi:hypothetical protein jhhlp_006235 [Lomentospora prolificans]|uniref:Uncharacterized protein n=1 Tax=Lomentospora prolificans TaxID=41688 RepID=A0A2N3N5C0_9PEZI|nr:hypothetical protein jhhlp_006235 [Lomentospora prolificans]